MSTQETFTVEEGSPGKRRIAGRKGPSAGSEEGERGSVGSPAGFHWIGEGASNGGRSGDRIKGAIEEDGDWRRGFFGVAEREEGRRSLAFTPWALIMGIGDEEGGGEAIDGFYVEMGVFLWRAKIGEGSDLREMDGRRGRGRSSDSLGLEGDGWSSGIDGVAGAAGEIGLKGDRGPQGEVTGGSTELPGVAGSPGRAGSVRRGKVGVGRERDRERTREREKENFERGRERNALSLEISGEKTEIERERERERERLRDSETAR